MAEQAVTPESPRWVALSTKSRRAPQERAFPTEAAAEAWCTSERARGRRAECWEEPSLFSDSAE